MIRAAQALLNKYKWYIHTADQVNRYNFEDRLIEAGSCINENIEILVVIKLTTALSHNG